MLMPGFFYIILLLKKSKQSEKYTKIIFDNAILA